MGINDKIMYSALRGLVFFLGLLVLVSSGFWPASTQAGVATYVDCYFDPAEGGEAKQRNSGIVLRFMLNTKLELAFRIDTAVARPVLLYVEEDGSFTLLDYHATTDVILVTVRRNGESMYSRHRLTPPPWDERHNGQSKNRSLWRVGTAGVRDPSPSCDLPAWVKRTMNSQLDSWHKLSYYGLMLLLVFAPLFRAGNRPLPLLMIELISLGLLLAMLWDPRRIVRIPLVFRTIGLAMLLLPVVYLLPLPESLIHAMPGRAIYADVLGSIAAEDWRSISIIPAATEYALYATLPVVAVFAIVYLLPVPQVKILVYILIGVAALQATLGLMQYGAGPDSALHFGNPYASKSASGTFANRDHLAGLLEMVLPVVLALMAATLGHGGMKSHRRRARWRQKIAFLSSFKGHQAALFGALGVLLLLGLVFTRSRAGLALAMLGLFLSLLAFAKRLGGKQCLWYPGYRTGGGDGRSSRNRPGPGVGSFFRGSLDGQPLVYFFLHFGRHRQLFSFRWRGGRFSTGISTFSAC